MKTDSLDTKKEERSITVDEMRVKMIALLDWYDKLSPANRVSVWSKNGEYSGIFTMDSEQLVDRFLSIKPKVPKIIDGSCPHHNIHCAYPKCEE